MVRGHERLAWELAPPPPEVGRVEYRIYIDGVAQQLTGVSCVHPAGAADNECQAPLPSLAPGVHTLWVSAVSEKDAFLEGPPSVMLTVRQVETGSQRADAAGVAAAAAVAAPDATVVATGLEDATDLAVLPDGALLVAERAGRVRLFRDGAWLDMPAVRLDDVATGDGRGLLSVAVDRDFARTQAVFLLYVTDTGLRAARYVLAGDVLTARAIVLDDLPVAATRPQARIRMGPDGALYIALDDGGNGASAGDLGSLSGKVLRVNQDGTTLADQPPGLPVLAAGLHRPAAMAWAGPEAALWIADQRSDGAPLLLDAGGTTSRRTFRAPVLLPPALGAPAAAVDVPGTGSGRGDALLVAGGAVMPALLSVQFGPAGAIAAVSVVPTAGLEGPVRALALAADGTVFLCTAQALFRLDLSRQ